MKINRSSAFGLLKKAAMPHKQVKLYRKLRYRKGHGVHSPFAYDLITKVIEEKSQYYVFQDIEKIRGELLSRNDMIADITGKETQHQKYGALLFRLVNFFQCNCVLQIGSSTGIMSLYLASSRPDCRCVVLEEREELGKFAESIAGRIKLDNIKSINGNYLNTVDGLLNKEQNIDMVFINIPHAHQTSEIIRKCLSVATKEIVFVIDGIRKDNAMKKVWKELVHNPSVNITIDLYTLGIVFVKNRMNKRHYKSYFDDGKKQNLHKNRRQRFNFIGWRKKSS